MITGRCSGCINIENQGEKNLYVWQSFHQNKRKNAPSSHILRCVSYRLSSLEIWLNVPSISSRAHYFYEAHTTQRYSVEKWKKKESSLRLPSRPPSRFTQHSHHRQTHKNRIISFHLARSSRSPNIIGSYRDEESPVATTGHNSINVFTQFNSPSASNSIDCRCFRNS